MKKRSNTVSNSSKLKSKVFPAENFTKVYILYEIIVRMNPMVSRCIHLPREVSGLFLCIAEQYFIVYKMHLHYQFIG